MVVCLWTVVENIRLGAQTNTVPARTMTWSIEDQSSLLLKRNLLSWDMSSPDRHFENLQYADIERMSEQ